MLDRHLAILDAFVRTRRPLRAEEIAQEADLPLSTTYRIVRELVEAALVQQEDNNHYWLGVRLLQYGGAVSERISVREVALPVMRRLAAETGETVHLTIPDGHEGVYVEKVDSPTYQLRWHISIGGRVPLYAGAAMKCLLAYLDSETVDAVLANIEPQPLAPETVVDPDRLRVDLAEIRSCGWAVSRQEINAGAAAVSAPIFDSRAEVVAGMTIAGAMTRFSDEVVDRYVELLLAATAEVSASVGGRQPEGVAAA